jgi:hypothetical protein
VFSTWIFGAGSGYFNLNRYIIDPDGQNQTTYQPSIRVARMTLLPGANAQFFDLTRSQNGDFHLNLTAAGRNWLDNANPGAEMTTELVANDELDRTPLRLEITKQ